MSVANEDRRQTRLVALPVAQITLNLPDQVPRELFTTRGVRVQLAELGGTDVVMLAMASARSLVRTWHSLATARMSRADAALVYEPGAIHQAIAERIAKAMAVQYGRDWEEMNEATRAALIVNAQSHITHLIQELFRHD